MRYGLEEELEEFTAYILGASKVPYIPYQEDGNWEPYLPRYENQTTRNGGETSGCTVWGSQNQLETLYNRLYREEPNYSERFTYLNVPINPGRGTDPQNTYEAIRKHGLVDERDLPMTDSLEDYLDTSDITGSLRAKGQNWLVRHDYQHEWLWTQRPANYIEVLKDALKTCPIGVSVSAWNREVDAQGNDVYVSYGSVNNHFCLLYKIDDEGYPWVFDSYDHSKKRLSKDHNIRRAKRIWINKRTVSALKRHKNILQLIVERLMQKKTWLQVCEDYLGSDASPRDLAADSVGCAETMTTLMQKVWPEVPVITGTYTMKDYLDKPSNGFVRTTVPVPGTIILCATGTGNGSFPGHTGVYMSDSTIASNDSRTGRFIKNYDLDTWTRRYVNKGGFQIFLYNRKV